MLQRSNVAIRERYESTRTPQHRPHSRTDCIQIVIADGTRMGAQMLGDTLSSGGDRLNVVLTTCRAGDVLDAAANAPIDVAVVNPALEDGSIAGLALVEQLANVSPNTRGIILANSSDPALIVEAFRRRAKGVITRGQSINDLRKCISVVHSGQIWASNADVEALVAALSKTAPVNIRNAKGEKILTPREEEIVSLVASGMTNAEISHALHLSCHTVKNYLFHIFDKVGVSSRVELILYGMSQPE